MLPVTTELKNSVEFLGKGKPKESERATLSLLKLPISRPSTCVCTHTRVTAPGFGGTDVLLKAPVRKRQLTDKVSRLSNPKRVSLSVQSACMKPATVVLRSPRGRADQSFVIKSKSLATLWARGSSNTARRLPITVLKLQDNLSPRNQQGFVRRGCVRQASFCEVRCSCAKTTPVK